MGESYATDLQDYERREIAEDVAEVIDAVRRRGDAALRDFAFRAHGETRAELRLDDDEIQRSVQDLPGTTRSRLADAQERMRTAAQAQRDCLRDCESQPSSGFVQGIRHVAVGSSAAYLSRPRGDDPRAGLPSFHAAVVLARCAGVSRVVACIRPCGGPAQSVCVAAAHIGGADEVYLLDGVHGIAALAVGTESVPRVDVVAGAGDPLTAEACHRLFGERALDVSARSDDLLLIADRTADARRAAAELIAAVLADGEARAVLVTASSTLAHLVSVHVEQALLHHPQAGVARAAWRGRGSIRVVSDAMAACALADRYAFGHVRVIAETPRWYLDRLRNHGTVSLGFAGRGEERLAPLGAPVAVDASAPRHPRALWIGHFMRAVTYREWADDGVAGGLASGERQLADTVVALAPSLG
ncbi:MAG TPA: histidinol dehydrogenase [Solirubrobacteraceae bacterium]|jgi:sulfopropanediol 3-dehydrogenase|nr:histidinol dehydrogenase [Solirubrobacteraceae bacterium]